MSAMLPVTVPLVLTVLPLLTRLALLFASVSSYVMSLAHRLNTGAEQLTVFAAGVVAKITGSTGVGPKIYCGAMAV